MKQLVLILLILGIASCQNETNKIPASVNKNTLKKDYIIVDSSLTLSYITNFEHKNISNKSNRRVDLLYNGAEGCFGGHRNTKINFQTECLSCEGFQEYKEGLLFADRLFMTYDKLQFSKTNFHSSDSIAPIKRNWGSSEIKNKNFRFKDGKGSIKYLGSSCNDASFYHVKLSFKSGDITIDSLLNAAVFEYDLNKDGIFEQYILGSRSCSQDLVLFRTTNY